MPGIVSPCAATLSVLVCLAGFVFLKLLAILVLIHTIHIFTLFLLFPVVAGSLITLGGSGVGSWRPVMNLLCLSISALWMVRSRPLKRCRSMSLRILILPGRLGFLSFHNSIRRFLMSVAFLLLAVGVALGALWVLSTQIQMI